MADTDLVQLCKHTQKLQAEDNGFVVVSCAEKNVNLNTLSKDCREKIKSCGLESQVKKLTNLPTEIRI